MQVTIFKDIKDSNNPNYIPLGRALERIKSGPSKEKVLSIRTMIEDGEDFTDIKKSLPLILFSASSVKEIMIKKRDGTGEYPSSRADESVVGHSGVFALDFDKCDVEQKIDQLKKDPYIYACWIGPSGRGVKALVKCPTSVENHTLYYTAFLDRYPDLDTTSRNISRGTFESYDPNLYVNENSLQWDRKMTEEQRSSSKKKVENRRGNQVISTAVAMIRNSYDGIKHESLRDAAVLLGGYISTGRINESEAIKVLQEEIRAKNPKDFVGACNTIQDGIEYGKKRPLHESKEIEKKQQFLKRDDGSYDFLASEEEMDEYEYKVINGLLEMGLVTGMNNLNTYWMFKKHTIVWFSGIDNVGKSFVLWYFSVLAAKFHDWKFIIHSAENGDGMVRKKLKEYYLGKSIKIMTPEELRAADLFVKTHYRIISSKQMHTFDSFLLKCEVLVDEGFEADCVIGEPWNSFDIKGNTDRYTSLIHNLNLLRVFKENYCSFWAADHVNTSSARAKDDEGYQLAPGKADIEMGQMKANKVDDFIVIHRLGNHPFKKNETQIHVVKIKDKETGGQLTEKDNPVIIELEDDYCGFRCNNINPIKHIRI